MEDKNPLSAVLNLLNKGLGLPIQAQDIGACHFLPSDYSVKPIIVRFIYDHQREFVWNAREDIRQLTGSSNRPVRVVQRLTEKDRNGLNYSNSNKLIVTTNKGKVLIKKSSTDQSWKYMKCRKDVDLLTWPILRIPLAPMQIQWRMHLQVTLSNIKIFLYRTIIIGQVHMQT